MKLIPVISHILENSSLVKPLLRCFWFFFTVPPSSACFLFVCFDVFSATSQHCQQTRDILVFWANVWVYKEVWGNVSSFHIWSPIASLYTVSEHIDTFPTCPLICILAHFWSCLSCLEPFSTWRPSLCEPQGDVTVLYSTSLATALRYEDLV